jgi:hypothetical protein
MLRLLLIAACVAGSSVLSNAEAFPITSAPASAESAIIPVRGFCGLGFHRGPYGGCVRNGMPYGYVAPVVVAPYAAPVVAPVVCPYGYYYYAPYGRCVPAR